MTPVTYAGANSYVDHELSVNLDSSEAFEGPEKLLEIWFFGDKSDIPTGSKTLRSISHADWAQLLDLVNCKTLSIKSSDCMDAFLLSESSLFVYDHKLILKTCGTTTTLFCLEYLFQLLLKELQWDFVHKQPLKVFYSRRAFMFPEKQRSIHKNWNDEVDYLNKFFEGSHYLIGRIDNSHWHLYVSVNGEDRAKDETFEVLMTGIDHGKAEQFVSSRKPGFEIGPEHDLGHFLGSSTSNNTGLNNLYNTVDIHDSFSFTPCGYSSNSILNEDSYYTLHVTPERDWSYASFESNVDPARYNLSNIDILFKVLAVFKPAKFQLTLFSNGDGESFNTLFKLDKLPHYKKLDKVLYDLNGYSLLYISFEMLVDEEMVNQLEI